MKRKSENERVEKLRKKFLKKEKRSGTKDQEVKATKWRNLQGKKKKA